MKWIFLGIAAVALVIFSLSVPAPIVSSRAYANKMDGKPGGGPNVAHYGQPKNAGKMKKSKGQ
jgi:hypothetical protein